MPERKACKQRDRRRLSGVKAQVRGVELLKATFIVMNLQADFKGDQKSLERSTSCAVGAESLSLSLTHV